MLIDELTDWILSRPPSHHVLDVRIGLGYTAVQLDDGRCGLAHTFREEAKKGCCVMAEAGAIAGRPAAELAGWAKSPDPIAAAVGLAAVNALVDPPAGAVKSDLLAAMSAGPDDFIGMVGFFGRLIDPLRMRARQLHVFERQPEAGALPEIEAKNLLPLCHVVILSATALLNRTIDDLLSHCRTAREIALLGPSTPFVPEVFLPRGN